ncbi:MAG TPA: N-acetylmuramoyl-L-alanine amidase [Candidatus Dormibacteraeota bacterium]|nr:N-acetylmuramoyl-L-alanine amidase [Candidatus Dormibacteraeota bacterium]
MRLPRLPVVLAAGVVLLTSLPTARAAAQEPSFVVPSPYVIAVDPGHGGSPTSDPTQLWDPGVVVGSVMEKDITLDLAFRLRDLLKQERVKVVLTRSRDEYVEISERWNRAQAGGARLFVSLHVNAFDGDPSINGASVFYPRSDSLPFAQDIDTGLAQSLKPYQIADDGVAAKPELWVHSDVPTATVEPVYLTNPREAALLQQSDFRQAIVQGIFNGILAADPQIEATKTQILRAEAAAAAQQRAEAAVATDADRTATAARWAAIVGGLLLLWILMRVAVRRRAPEAPTYRRRNIRRRSHRF